MNPGVRELAALSALAALGCGLAAGQGDLLFVALFGAASIVTIIEAIRRLRETSGCRTPLAIRTLPDVRLGVVSECLEHLFMDISLKPRHARGFLCLSVYWRHRTRRQGPRGQLVIRTGPALIGADDKSRPVAPGI